MGRRRHRHPRRPRRRPANHGDVLRQAWTAGERNSVVRRLPRDAGARARHPGHRQHHAGPPARRHQRRRAPEGQGRHFAQAAGERAPGSAPGRRGGAGEHGAHRICSPTATPRIATPSPRGSAPARSGPCAKCTTGPTGRSGRRAGRSTTSQGRRCPDGFNWTLWQGPEPDRPYHPNYTFCLYRGWYAYGAGCLARHGLLQPVAAVPHPESWRTGVRRSAAQQRCHRQRAARERRRSRVARRAPARQHRALAPSRDRRPARRSTPSGTTAA